MEHKTTEEEIDQFNDDIEINLLEETVINLQTEFYSKPFSFSYSSINTLLYNPVIFFNTYVLKAHEERIQEHLATGKLIHLLMLEPEKFEEKFIEYSFEKLPSKNILNILYTLYKELKLFPDSIVESLDKYDDRILELLKEKNLFQHYKEDSTKLKSFREEFIKKYWDYLRTKGNKTIITKENNEFCKKAVEVLLSDPNVCNRIGCNITEFNNVEVFNELEFDIKNSSLPFGFKGIIDNLVINHDEKTITITDIKTTSKTLAEFKNTVDYYKYWIQAVIYLNAVGNHLYKHLVEQNYSINFGFLVIDKYFNNYCFEVSEKTSEEWFRRFNSEVLPSILFHYNEKSYHLPYEFQKGIVYL